MRRQFPIMVTALAILGLLAACSDESAPPLPNPEVGVIRLQAEDVALQTELPGRISALETSEVRPQITGLIRQMLFTEGSIVRAGQPLYRIDSAPYRAARASALAALARAQATINATSLQAKRYNELVGINAVSKQEADNANAAAQQARADVAAQRAALQAADVNLGYTTIRAPISGRIGRSVVTRGALVQAGQAAPLATIQRTDQVYVDVTQSAAQILDLKEQLAAGGLISGNDTARVRLQLPNSKEYPIEGTLQFSEITVDESTGAVTLRAKFANPGGLLLPGMYVRAQLVEGVKQQAILVPQQAIARDPNGMATALVVGKDNKVEQRKVEVDRFIGDKWLIRSGLNADDRLIVEGLMSIKPGMVVTPKKPEQITVPDRPQSNPAQKKAG